MWYQIKSDGKYEVYEYVNENSIRYSRTFPVYFNPNANEKVSDKYNYYSLASILLYIHLSILNRFTESYTTLETNFYEDEYHVADDLKYFFFDIKPLGNRDVDSINKILNDESNGTNNPFYHSWNTSLITLNENRKEFRGRLWGNIPQPTEKYTQEYEDVFKFINIALSIRNDNELNNFYW